MADDQPIEQHAEWRVVLLDQFGNRIASRPGGPDRCRRRELTLKLLMNAATWEC